MDESNLAPWLRVINEGDLVVFQAKLCSVCHVEDIHLNEGNCVKCYHVKEIDNTAAQIHRAKRCQLSFPELHELDEELDLDSSFIEIEFTDNQQTDEVTSVRPNAGKAEPKQRFATLTMTDVQEIAGNSVGSRTKSKTKWGVNILRG